MILDTLKKILEEQLEIDPSTINENTDIAEDLGADSLDQVELVMALEEEFGADIPDEAAEKLTTVGDAIAYVESKNQG